MKKIRFVKDKTKDTELHQFYEVFLLEKDGETITTEKAGEINVPKDKKDMFWCTKKILRWLLRNEYNNDCALYFQDIRFLFDSYGNLTIQENEFPTKYFCHANNKSINMTFEGDLYHALNSNTSNGHKAQEELRRILAKHDLWMEFGSAWNFRTFKDED